MSADDQGGAGRREVAYRLFAAEFEDADLSYSESDEERAPNYVVTPTGARVNRLFVVGVLTEVDRAGEDVLRARVVDPTGAFVVYAGQYQPDAQAFFERADPPAFVAVTGKARTFQPDDADVVYTSVRPENVNEVTAETRDRWNVGAARQTLDRVATMADALTREERGDDLRAALEAEGVDAGLAAGVPLAIDHYGTAPAYLDAVRELAVGVAELVAGERDEVDTLAVDPDAPGDADPAALADLSVPASANGTAATPASEAEATADAAATATSETETAGTGTAAGTGETDGTAGTEPESADETTETDSEPAETTASTDPEPAESTGTTGPPDAAGTDEDAETADAGSTADATETGEEIGDFDPGEFDLDEEEREAIEEEYGTDFRSGTEVDDPGEAGIETPDPDSVADADADAEPATRDEEAVEPAAEDGEDGTEATAGEPDADEAAEEIDVETAVLEAMEDHDDGGGAPESAIVDDVTERLGVDEAAVADALQEALMDGQCYEPEDGVYKSI